MILLIDLIVVCAVGLWLFLLFTQVILPLFRGTKLFPAFRKNELAERLEAERDLVGNLREQNTNLTELQKLLAQRAELEKQISALETPPQSETQPTKE